MSRKVIFLQIPDDGGWFDTKSLYAAQTRTVSEGMLVAEFRNLIAESLKPLLNIDRDSVCVYPANIPYDNVDKLEAQRKEIQNSEIEAIFPFEEVGSYLEPWSAKSVHFLFSVQVVGSHKKFSKEWVLESLLPVLISGLLKLIDSRHQIL